jgi:hypothetical protein
MVDDLAHTILIELSRHHVDCLKLYNPSVKSTHTLSRDDAPAMSQMVGMVEDRTWHKPRIFALYKSNFEHDLTWLKPLGIVKISKNKEAGFEAEALLAADGVQHDSLATKAKELWDEQFAPKLHSGYHAKPQDILQNLGVEKIEQRMPVDRVQAILAKLGIQERLSPAMRSL